MSSEIDLDEIRRLEELAFAGWPALETVDHAGWRSRFAGGYTKRSNSINALAPTAAVAPEIMAGLEQAYRARGQAPVWRLTPLAPAAARDRLAGPRYQAIERSLVQGAAIDGRFAPDAEVQIEDRPSQRWLEAVATHGPVAPRHREAMRGMLAAMPSPGFAFVERAGVPLATAIGVIQGDRMGLFDVLVMPHARRQGLARRVTESLYAWAGARGARQAHLQVVATNGPALALYAAQGFRTLYEYEYRVPSA